MLLTRGTIFGFLFASRRRRLFQMKGHGKCILKSEIGKQKLGEKNDCDLALVQGLGVSRWAPLKSIFSRSNVCDKYKVDALSASHPSTLWKPNTENTEVMTPSRRQTKNNGNIKGGKDRVNVVAKYSLADVIGKAYRDL